VALICYILVIRSHANRPIVIFVTPSHSLCLNCRVDKSVQYCTIYGKKICVSSTSKNPYLERRPFLLGYELPSITVPCCKSIANFFKLLAHPSLTTLDPPLLGPHTHSHMKPSFQQAKDDIGTSEFFLAHYSTVVKPVASIHCILF
jgi:hypothetical protein